MTVEYHDADAAARLAPDLVPDTAPATTRALALRVAAMATLVHSTRLSGWARTRGMCTISTQLPYINPVRVAASRAWIPERIESRMLG